jgi:hypothetical protein
MSKASNLAGFSTSISPPASLNVGVVTATSFFGSGANLTGIANTANIVSDTINVGVLTATRLDVAPVPVTFSPAIGATSVALASNIIITFNQSVTKGTGNITLRENSAGGTAFSTIGVSSSSVTISGGAVTIDPPSNIGSATTTFVVVDAGAFSGITTTSVNALIDNYSFTTVNITNPLFSWGLNSFGRLGQNTTTDISSPVQIPGTTWSSISGGDNHSLATKTDGTLYGHGVIMFKDN